MNCCCCRSEFTEQREYIYQAINEIPGCQQSNLKRLLLYLPKIDMKRFDVVNDEQFVLDFLHEHHILLVHGGGFNWQQPDAFRGIVVSPKMDDLKTTTKAMREFLSTYRQQH